MFLCDRVLSSNKTSAMVVMARNCIKHTHTPSGCSRTIYLIMSSPQAAVESLLWHLEHLLSLLYWAGCLQNCFSQIFLLLTPSWCSAGFLPFLIYVITETLPMSLMGSALASGGSVFHLADTGSIRHGDIVWCLLTQADPATPATTNFLIRKVLWFWLVWFGV